MERIVITRDGRVITQVYDPETQRNYGDHVEPLLRHEEARTWLAIWALNEKMKTKSSQ